ncbi:MAG: hypothetical protein ACRCS9_02800 [Hyphomicrobium sp.]
MQLLKRTLAAAGLMSALTLPAVAVNHLTFEQLLSVVLFENENAYADPTGFVCRFINLTDPTDSCKVDFRVVDERSCKVEIVREIRATYTDGAERGREFIKLREVFTLASLNLMGVGPPDIDEVARSARVSFKGEIDIYRHEGYHYTYALDQSGAYKGCRVDGVVKDIPEAACIEAGTHTPSASKSMSLVFNQNGYNRSLAAVRWLQKNYCPSGGEAL